MIGKFESNKDLIQELTSSGARHVGNIAGIITGTVAEVTREIGEWITDAIEMNEAAAVARQDAAAQRGDELVDDDDFAGTSVKERADVSYDAEVEPSASFVEAEVVEPEAENPR
jgi:ribosomal protein S17E